MGGEALWFQETVLPRKIFSVICLFSTVICDCFGRRRQILSNTTVLLIVGSTPGPVANAACTKRQICDLLFENTHNQATFTN